MQGVGFFSFQVPSNTTSFLQTIAFVVSYNGIDQTYSQPLVITQNDMMVIDFYTENSGPLVTNVTNKVFFQAWATSDRADVYDFNSSSLKAVLLSDNSVVTIISSTILTEHRGKGAFSYIHLPNYASVYLEIPIAEGTINIRRNLAMTPFPYMHPAATTEDENPLIIYNVNSEVTFTVLNQNRVIDFGGAVRVKFMTNSFMDSTDQYLLQLKFKEEVLAQQQLQFNQSMNNLTVTIKPNASFANGGVMTVNLYKISKELISYYKKNESADTLAQITAETVISWL